MVPSHTALSLNYEIVLFRISSPFLHTTGGIVRRSSATLGGTRSSTLKAGYEDRYTSLKGSGVEVVGAEETRAEVQGAWRPFKAS
jgi:hypothetical protein